MGCLFPPPLPALGFLRRLRGTRSSAASLTSGVVLRREFLALLVIGVRVLGRSRGEEAASGL